MIIDCHRRYTTAPRALEGARAPGTWDGSWVDPALEARGCEHVDGR